jgi:hypothetical protein
MIGSAVSVVGGGKDLRRDFERQAAELGEWIHGTRIGFRRHTPA